MSPGTLSLVLNLSYVVKPLAMTTEPENLVLDSLLSVVLQFVCALLRLSVLDRREAAADLESSS
jgi:hypothetical protein